MVMDCGAPPPGPYSTDAHAGCLSFEFSSGTHRIVVNCGSASDARRTTWDSALRATAAHSTMTLADTTTGAILSGGWSRKLLGPRLIGGVTQVDTQRAETSEGWMVEGGHDGYVAPFGIRHERQVMLGTRGLALTGLDRVLPANKTKRQELAFAVRFHIHPDVRVSPSQGGDVILKLPNGEGWRFRAGVPVAVEESVYLGGDTLRRTEQLVLAGTVSDKPVEVSWVFEQIERD